MKTALTVHSYLNDQRLLGNDQRRCFAKKEKRKTNIAACFDQTSISGRYKTRQPKDYGIKQSCKISTAYPAPALPGFHGLQSTHLFRFLFAGINSRCCHAFFFLFFFYKVFYSGE